MHEPDGVRREFAFLHEVFAVAADNTQMQSCRAGAFAFLVEQVHFVVADPVGRKVSVGKGPELLEYLAVNLNRAGRISPHTSYVCYVFLYLHGTSPNSAAFFRMRESASSKLLPISPSRMASFTASLICPMVLQGSIP